MGFVCGCYFLFAGRRAYNWRGEGGSEVEGGGTNTSSSGQYLAPHLSILKE